MLMNPQKRVVITLGGRSSDKGFSCIDFHSDGYIAAGTTTGDLYIWNKNKDKELTDERNRIIYDEHRKDCHLTIWNEEGTMLLTASFDGSAKIWGWDASNFAKNRGAKSIDTIKAGFEKKKNEPAGEVRCSAAAWSCKGRYAIACFSKTINPETNDVKVLSNLQVYDTFLKTRTQKIERIYDNTELENYIFIIEVHPFNESIIFTADHDGKLIIWDIDIGVPLNCFVETCDHIGYPLSNASILDGRFSPDGLSFAITTSMGSFSIYGYGDRGLFVPIPCEQFFEKEYDEFEVEEVTHRILDPATNEELHLINKGPICNYSGTAYNPNIVEKDCNKTAEELYYEKYKSSEQKEKDKYKQNAYSKECIASIPRIMNGLIKKDIEYYTKKLLSRYEGKFPFSELRLDAKQFFMRDTQERQHSFHTPAIANGLQQRSRSNQIQAAIPVQQEDIRMELEQLPEELPAARNTQEEAHKETRQENENQEAHATEEITNVRYGTRLGSRRGLRIDENDDEEGGAQQIYNTRRRETGGRRQKMILDDMDDDNDNDQFDEEFKIDPIHDKKPQKSFIRPTKSSKLKPGSSLLMDIEPQCPQESIDNSAKQNEDDEGEQKTTHARMRRKYRPEPPSNLNNTEEITFPEDGHRNTRRIATLNERENTAFNRLINLATSGEVGACSRCKEENARVKCETCSNLYHQRCAKYRGCLVATSIIRRGFQCFECQNKKSKKDLMPYVNISRSWASSEIKQDYVYSPQPGDKVCFIFQAYEEFIAKFFANLDFENPEDIFSYEKVASLQLENSCEVVEVKYHFPVYNKKSKHFEIHNLLCLVVLKTLSDVSGETFKVWYFPVEGNDSLQFLIPKKKFDQGLAAFSKLQLNSEMELSHDGELSKFIIYEVATREAEFYSSRNIYYKTIKIIELKESADKLRLTSLEDLDNMIQTISPWDLMNHIPLPEFLEKENGLTTASLGRLEYDIQKYYDENSNDFEPFYEEVDKTAYPEYQAIIPLEMNLNFLLKRLKNDYYRSKEAIISDAALIGQNAAIFNVSGSEIALSGAQLSENIAHFVRGEPDKILARTNTMQSEETGVQYRVQNSMEQVEENQGGDQKGTIVRLYRQPIDAIDNDDSLQYQRESKDNGRNRDDLKIQISLQPDFMKRRPTRSSRAVNYKEESQVDHLNKQTALGNQPAERKTGIVRTRSGREISSNNALRQTRGGITNHPSQTRNSRLAPSSREAVTNTKSIDNDADERVYTGRLRARKAGSRIKEYDSDDNADNDYLIELEKQSTDRKKVKSELVHGTEQRPEESLRMNDSDTRGSGSNQEVESTGVRTRKSLRSNTVRVQEQAAVHTQPEQVETNPLEQNFSGVRTRSRLTRGTTPK